MPLGYRLRTEPKAQRIKCVVQRGALTVELRLPEAGECGWWWDTGRSLDSAAEAILDCWRRNPKPEPGWPMTGDERSLRFYELDRDSEAAIGGLGPFFGITIIAAVLP